MTVTETQRPGYALHQAVVGRNAICTRTDTGDTVATTNVADGFRVTAGEGYAVTCRVYNAVQAPLASLLVDKTWRINGQDFDQGTQPANFVAALSIDGTDQPFGVVRTGLREGDQPVVAERIQNIPRQCTLDSARVVEADGAAVDRPLPDTVTLVEGENTLRVRNVVTWPTLLTLVKDVRGGTEPATSWTLDAAPPAGAVVGPAGTSGSPATTGVSVTPGARYVLSEQPTTAGARLYRQDLDPNVTLPPGATGSWLCREVERDGLTVVPGFVDGLIGSVAVPLGKWIRCTAVNRTATLSLRKVVVNDDGGTAAPADWRLTAMPVGDVPDGVVAQSVDGSTGGASLSVRPGVRYALSESGPGGYRRVSTTCTDTPGTSVDEVTLDALDAETCTFTNDDTPARLTLVKTLDDPQGYGGAEATDFALTATGPSTITGATGTSTVTAAAVRPATYALSESGPAGYDASDWTCRDTEGGTVAVTGSSIALALGDTVTCTIVNTAPDPVYSISKSSDPASGTTVLPGSEITYRVDLRRGAGFDPRDVVVSDDLGEVLEHATLVGTPKTCADASCTASLGTASVSGSALTWKVARLAVPDAHVSYTVRVDDDAYGVTLVNVATAPGGTACTPACPTTTRHPTPAWSLTKSSDPDPGVQVGPGDEITYTLTAENTTDEAVVARAVAEDDLSDVLDHATLDAVPDGASLSGSTLTWDVPELGPGESADLTYTVTVDDDADAVTLTNVAIPGPGGTCTTCTTRHRTPDPSHHGGLAGTGGPTVWFVVLGGGLLLLGAAALGRAQRRRRRSA